MSPNKGITARLFAASVLLGLAVSSHALESDRKQPLHVSADSASADQKAGRAVYKGDVQVQQGTMKVNANEVTLILGAKNAVQKVIAKGGPARYQQQPEGKNGLVIAEAQNIDYDAAADTITLSGNASLKQDGSSFSGATISYSISRQQVNAKGSGDNRVKLVFPPAAKD